MSDQDATGDLNNQHLSRSEPRSSSPQRQVIGGEVRGSKDVADEGKTRKKRRSREVHNLKERIRRQKLAERVCIIQELIPNCDKVDRASILDEAAKYMSALQIKVQMTWMEVRYSALMPQPGLQEMQSQCLGTYPQTGSLGGGMGMSDGPPPFNFPTSQFGVPNEHISTLPASAGIPATAHTMPSATSSMVLEASYATFTGFQSTIGGESGPSQGPPSGAMESRPSVYMISDVHATSMLPAPAEISAAIQNLGNVLESQQSSTSSIDLEALNATVAEFKRAIGGEGISSEGTPSSERESSAINKV